MDFYRDIKPCMKQLCKEFKQKLKNGLLINDIAFVLNKNTPYKLPTAYVYDMQDLWDL